MSPTLPPQLEGTHAPNTIELLWEKHRRKINALFWALAILVAGYYGFRYYEQGLRNREWSTFAANALLDAGYAPEKPDPRTAESLDSALLTELEEADAARLEGLLPSATPAQRPYVLWLLANKAVLARDWDKAEATLAQLEREFPDHSLCKNTDYPVQVRPEVKEPAKQTQDDRKPAPQEPKLQPARKGSKVAMLREQLAAARSFQLPSQFDKPAIPETAPRYRIKLKGYGEFTIALLCERASKHCEKFQQLVDMGFWNDIAVDEVNRPMRDIPKRYWSQTQFHFGLPITKETTDRTKWDASKPSEYLVEEVTNLSHFAGAVACRADSDGKSAVDRLWICAEDLAAMDGQRQVIGYVVEGLDVVESVCAVTLSNEQEEQMGRGKPAENVVVESVTRL